MVNEQEAMGPFGRVTIPPVIWGYMTPRPDYHYGPPMVSQGSRDGPICVYLSGNGPLGDRVDMVAIQQPASHGGGCLIRTLLQPGDHEINRVVVIDQSIYLTA